ncbi:MAG: hypothetical protein FJ319_02645 [SAR202 cluster bacterium]|nr:hypothetical protein [SAR202 cluster bacterium]
MPQPTLDEQFSDGIPSRGYRSPQQFMSAKEQRYVLYGLLKGWTVTKIGRSIGVSDLVVRQIRARVTRTPETLLDLGICEALLLTTGPAFRCLVCGSMLTSEEEVRSHVPAHFMEVFQTSRRADEDIAQTEATVKRAPGVSGRPRNDGPDSDHSWAAAFERLAAMRDAQAPASVEAPRAIDAAVPLPAHQSHTAPAIAAVDPAQPTQARQQPQQDLPLPTTAALYVESATPPRRPVVEPAVETRTVAAHPVAEAGAPATAVPVERPATAIAPVIEAPVPPASPPQLEVPAATKAEAPARAPRPPTAAPGATGKAVAALTIERGAVKMLVYRNGAVVDFGQADCPGSMFKGSLASDTNGVASALAKLAPMAKGKGTTLVAAAPGYQSKVNHITLPKANGMNPAVVIPQIARRTLGISPETSRIAWKKQASSLEENHWAVVSTTSRSLASLTATVRGAGFRLSAVELRAFAMARATGQSSAVCAWTAADGMEVIVVRDWTPVTCVSHFWGAEAEMDGQSIVNHVLEVIESVIESDDGRLHEGQPAWDLPVYLTGSPVQKAPGMVDAVAKLLGRGVSAPVPPVNTPPGFPLHDYFVNLGLAMGPAARG